MSSERVRIMNRLQLNLEILFEVIEISLTWLCGYVVFVKHAILVCKLFKSLQ